MQSQTQKTLTVVLFAVYILLLTGIILFKLPFYSEKISDGVRVINLAPFQGSFNEDGAVVWPEIVCNVLLFIPFGIYISMLKREWFSMKKVLPILGLSLTFESMQFIFAMGRTDVTDIINNTLGGIIGIGVYSLFLMIFRKRTVKVVNVFAAVLTVCVVLRFAQLFYLSHFVMGRPPVM